MLRRVISLAIVCAGLLLAGAPTFACTPNVPLNDCCPTGPGGPCRAPGGVVTQAVVACCAAGTTASATTASMAPLSDSASRPGSANPLPAAGAPSFDAAIVWTRTDLTLADHDRAYRPSGSALYLSTGRLRL